MRSLLRMFAGVGTVVLLFWVGANLMRPPVPDPPPPPELTDATVPAGDAAGSSSGNWTLEADDSFVGYRIVERDPSRWGKGENEAVGRTDALSGSLQVDGDVLVSAEVDADLYQLESDNERRDAAIRPRYLQTREFPDGRFELTEPVDLADLAPGEVQRLQAAGALTLRDTTEAVQVDLDVRWTGDTVEVVGSLPIALPDYGIRPPRLPGFRFVEPTGTIELHLVFTRE